MSRRLPAWAALTGGRSAASRGPRTPGPTRSSTRLWTACAEPLVVEPQQRDHVVDVALAGDPPRGGSDAPREHGMIGDPAGIVKLMPHGLGEGEMGGVVAVEVADLAPG